MLDMIEQLARQKYLFWCFVPFNHADFLITFSRSSKSEKCVVHVYVLKCTCALKWYTQLFLIILFFSLLHLIIIIHLQ